MPKALRAQAGVEQYQIELALLEARVVGQGAAAPGRHRQSGELADRREIVGVDEAHRCQRRVQRCILLPTARLRSAKSRFQTSRAPPAAAQSPTPQV